MNPAYGGAVVLTLKLAGLTTLILLLLGTPLAWWLARTRSWVKLPIGALVALPLVLPPTVLGFYLLVALGPHGPLGQLTQSLGLGLLPFTFSGLVLGSVIYSMPFVLQPLQNAFEAIGEQPLEAAATLRASPLDTFIHVVLPLALRNALPALGNNLVNLVKTTNLAYAIAVPELMYVSKEIWSDASNVREMMVFLLLVYVGLVALLVAGLNRLERALQIPGYGQLGGR